MRSGGRHETLCKRLTPCGLDYYYTEFAEFRRVDYALFAVLPEKPENFAEMVRIAEKRTEGKLFLRVDLYSIAGKTCFSERTFSPCSGMMAFEPVEWDAMIGQWLSLPGRNGEK